MMFGLGSMRVETGTSLRDRVRLIFEQVYKSLRWPLTRTIAVQMILDADCPAQNRDDVDKVLVDECQVAAIFWSFKRNGTYLGDIRDVDTYQTLKRTAELGMHPSPVLAATIPQYRTQIRSSYDAECVRAGRCPLNPLGSTQFVFDCDDAVISLMALLNSVGFRVGAKAISADGRGFGHIYAVVELPRYVQGARRVVPLDATEYEAYPGWEPGPEYRRVERVFWYSEKE